jgi:hypothetical protein
MNWNTTSTTSGRREVGGTSQAPLFPARGSTPSCRLETRAFRLDQDTLTFIGCDPAVELDDLPPLDSVLLSHHPG